jgi:Icc-related predicted phosphoesterase
VKILFISDVYSWEKSFEVLEKESPDVVLLGGDLVSDGATEFKSLVPFNYQEYRVKVAAYLRKHQNEIEKTKWGIVLNRIITRIQKGEPFYDDVYYHFKDDATNSLNVLLNRIFHDLDKHESLMKNTAELKKWRNKLQDFLDGLTKSFRSSDHFNKGFQMHVELFYEFLETAGRKTNQVYTVMGNHDKQFEEYNASRINSIPGCNEISGTLVDVNNYKLLGLGYDETHYLRKLKPLLNEYSGSPDLILTHAEDKRLSLISDFKPKIVLRGHWGSGRYFVNDTMFISSAIFPRYATLKIENDEVKSIHFYKLDSNKGYIPEKV